MDIPQILNPDATGGPNVRVNHIGVGRLLCINPTAIQEDAPHMSGGTKPRVTADVAILDGATPFDFGGSEKKNRPNSMRVTRLPYLIRGMWIQETLLVQQLRSRIGKGVVVGRLAMGQATNGNNAPWVINDPTPEEVEYVRSWLTAKATGQWTNPDPIELNPQPAQNQPAQPGQWVGSGAAVTPPATAQPEPPMPSGFDPAKWAAATLDEKHMIIKFMGGAQATPAPAQAVTAGTGIW